MSGQALNLPTCACVLLRVPGTPDDAVRPYTPISEEARRGSFDLLPMSPPYLPCFSQARRGSFDLLVKRYAG